VTGVPPGCRYSSSSVCPTLRAIASHCEALGRHAAGARRITSPTSLKTALLPLLVTPVNATRGSPGEGSCWWSLSFLYGVRFAFCGSVPALAAPMRMATRYCLCRLGLVFLGAAGAGEAPPAEGLASELEPLLLDGVLLDVDVDIALLLRVVVVVVVVVPASGTKGLRERPARWRGDPLTVSAADLSTGVCALSAIPEPVCATDRGGGPSPPEPPPSSTYAST